MDWSTNRSSSTNITILTIVEKSLYLVVLFYFNNLVRSSVYSYLLSSKLMHTRSHSCHYVGLTVWPLTLVVRMITVPAHVLMAFAPYLTCKSNGSTTVKIKWIWCFHNLSNLIDFITSGSETLGCFSLSLGPDYKTGEKIRLSDFDSFILGLRTNKSTNLKGQYCYNRGKTVFSQLSNWIRSKCIQFSLFIPQVLMSSETYQTGSTTAGLTPLAKVQTSLK